MLALTGIGSVAAGCSAPASPTALATPHSTPSASPTSGHCASVRTTTPITDVPEACAALWAPYQVTEVPPPDILAQEHVPPAPTVVNKTDGAVSQAEAQRWADASNRGSGWYKWAYAFTQPSFLLHLVSPALINRVQDNALGEGARIDVPDCDLYPIANALYKLEADGRAYLERNGLTTNDAYLFVVTYRGPCTLTTTYPDGHVTRDGPFFAQPTKAFAPGTLREDPVLGAIWFGDAGGNCNDPAGPPAIWCGR